jgi:hypothetical protein
MKKLYLPIAIVGLLLSSLTGFSQTRELQRDLDVFVNYVNLFRTSSDYAEEYKGTPYANESFLPGSIYVNGKLYAKDVALRYNAVMDEMEVKKSINDDDSKISALMKTPGITVEILDTLYLYVPNKGYFQIAYSGKNYNLLKKIGKKYFPPKPAKNSFENDYPAEFVDRVSFFLYKKNTDLIELPSSKKKLLKAFGPDEGTVKKIMKERSLNPTNEEDLIKIVAALDAMN